jgi:hypothetical protein
MISRTGLLSTYSSPKTESSALLEIIRASIKGRNIRIVYCSEILQATPCQLVFGRDMIHNIAFRVNWYQIQKRKQDIINKSNQKENKNKSRIPYEYKVSDQVLLETPGILRKLSTPRIGPYPVTNVYKNGTIRIQKGKEEMYQKEWISVESLHSIKCPIKYDLRGKWHIINLRSWIKMIIRN